MKSFLNILVGIFLSLGMGALLCVCSFEEPVAPVWDVPVQIPVVNQMYTLEDLAEDADQLTVDPLTQNVIFKLEQEVEARQIGQFLKISGSGRTVTMNMPPNGFAGYMESRWDSLSIPDSIRVVNAVLESGMLDSRLNNRSTYSMSIAVEVTSLNLNGPFQIEVDLPQGSEFSTTRLLDGYTFAPDENNVIPYKMTIRILETYGNQGGELDVSVDVSNLAFREVTGVFDEIHVGFDEKIMDVTIQDM